MYRDSQKRLTGNDVFEGYAIDLIKNISEILSTNKIFNIFFKILELVRVNFILSKFLFHALIFLLLRCGIFVFVFSSRSLKTREKYISFAQFAYFLREVCLLFNF